MRVYIAQSKYTKLCHSFLVPIHVCSFHSFSNFFHRQADTQKKHFLQFTLFILLLCTAIYSFYYFVQQFIHFYYFVQQE